MISLEKFKKIVDGLRRNVEYLDKVCELVGNPDVVYEHACLDEAIEALAAAMQCDEQLLFQWTMECEFGSEWDEPYVAEYGVDLKTTEQLYEYLAANLPCEYPEEQTVFALPSEVPGCPVFELTYHPLEGQYTMSMETIYQMNEKEADDYVHNIWEKFTDWMVDNGHGITTPVHLSVFEDGVCLRRPYSSAEDAYAAFTVLAHGVGLQGVTSEE